MQTSMDRREFLGLATGTLAGSMLLMPRPASALDYNDRNDAFRAFTKMRGALDDRVIQGWVTGTRYAALDGRTVPMYKLLAATFGRYVPLEDGNVLIRTIEVAYFTDLATGKLIDTWENPFTGKTVEVPQTRLGPSKYRMTPAGILLSDIPRLAPMDSEHKIMDPVVIGEDVWITEEIRIFGEIPGDEVQPFRYNEVTTYQSTRQELDDPDTATAPTSIQYSSLNGFSEWSGMEGLNALNMGIGAGRKAPRIEDLPPYYLELTEKHHPDVLNDPAAVLAQAE